MRAITHMLNGNEQLLIHEASLEIMERTGAEIDSEKIRNILQKKGAKVIGKNVRFPQKMTEEYLKLVNREIIMGARNDRYTFSLPAPAN